MSKSRETFGKREREKRRLQHRQEKREKMLQRKANEGKGKSLNDMIAYLDENGNLSSTPADANLRSVVIDDNTQYTAPSEQQSHYPAPRIS